MMNSGVPRTSLGLFLVVLLLPHRLPIIAGALSQPVSLYMDSTCSKNCSWSYQHNRQRKTQFCEMQTGIDQHALISTECHNPFRQSVDVLLRPKPAIDITLSDFNRKLNSSDDKSTTCLNITYKLDEFSAEKIKGIQIRLLGFDYKSLNQFICVNLNFSLAGLHYYSVLKNKQNVKFQFTCFCGLMPGQLYRGYVRTMPVDIIDGDEHDTTISMDHTVTECSHPQKVSDIHCQHPIAADWLPKCIMVQQNTTAGDYNTIEVSYDIAPSSFKFDTYHVYIYMYTNKRKLIDIIRIKMSSATTVERTCPPNLPSHSVPFVTATFNRSHSHYTNMPWPDRNLQFNVAVQPSPTVTNKCASKQTVQCSKKRQDFSLKNNPCDTVPCGAHGHCIPNEEMYSCDCKTGHMEWNNTCTRDPCLDLTSNGLNVTRYCQNGNCIYNVRRDDFYCYCQENFFEIGKACIADPCLASPETNTTVCGTHGRCNRTVTDISVEHSCICDRGYTVQDYQCQKASTGVILIVVVTVVSCTAGLMLSVIVICYVHKRHCNRVSRTAQGQSVTYHECNRDVGNGTFSGGHVTCAPFKKPIYKSPSQSLQKRRRHIVPLYSNDHPLHRDVVLRFCSFLKIHCRCDVSLIDWETSVSPSVDMWLTAKLDEADIVLLFCSKGTKLKYEAKAKMQSLPTDTEGVLGDVFVKALFFLDDYFHKSNATEKFAVVYFNYSSDDDIPVTFQRFAKFRLMDCMEELFMKIHGTVTDSPLSTRHATELKKDNYPSLEMGGPLKEAIIAMENVIMNNHSWYENQNMGRKHQCISSPNLYNDLEVYNSKNSNDCVNFDDNKIPGEFFCSNGDESDSSMENDVNMLSFPVCSASPDIDLIKDQPESGYFSERQVFSTPHCLRSTPSVGPTTTEDLY